MYKELRPAQKRVVDELDGPMLVIAGPGTGKTFAISMRVAAILERTDSLPQNILCLTFTDSAVVTLRERLSGLIGQAAYDVNISTYHTFGSELIRRYPEYFAASADLRAVDELGIDSIFREVLETLPYTNPLKHSANYLRDIKSLVSDCKRALLTPADIRVIAASNQKFLSAMDKKVSSALKNLVRVDKKSAGLFQQLAADQRSETLPDNIVPLGQLWQSELSGALEHFNATGKTTLLTKWKNGWLAKDSRGAFVASGSAAVRKLEGLADIYEQYLLKLGEEGLYDYDDMILRAIRGLNEHADLRYSLQEQYLYLLLDEFQDTNAAQLRLIELLTDNPVHEGRPNVMAVGDDDQAIFAFQGADYSHMLAFNDLYRDVKLVPLTENFRSHKDILHIAHGISSQIEERLHHKFEGIDKVLTAENKKLPADAKVERHEFKSGAGQYAWIAAQIKKLIKEGLVPSEIAVLAPQHKYLEPAIAYLQAASIDVRYEKRENVLDDPRVSELVVMSELVLAINRRDQSAADELWPQVLSMSFWQVPTSRIWQLSWQANDTDSGWTELILNDTALKDIGLFFLRLSLILATEDLETMLDYLIGTQPAELLAPDTPLFYCPFYEFYFGSQADKPGFWDVLSTLSVLREHLRTYKNSQDESLVLADLIGFVSAHRQAGIKILNTSPYFGAVDAVQVMTAYKAKGQEFTAVFVVAGIDEAWGMKAVGQSSKIALPLNLVHIRHAGSTNDERLRLLYVAITRARNQLYLTSYATSFAGKATTRLRYLNESEDGNGAIVSPLLPARSQSVHPSDVNVPTIDTLGAYWNQRHVKGSREPELSALLAPRLEKLRFSPTHLNSFTDVIYGGPEYFFMNTILRFPKAPGVDGQYGNAIHETLHWLHLYKRQHSKLPGTDELSDAFERKLRSKRLSPHHTELLLERGLRCLDVYLKRRGDTVLAADESEFSFRGEGAFIGKVPLNGKIDKLIIDKENKTVTVVDYKTGKSFSHWNNSEAKLHKYRQQLYLYKRLVEGSHTFAGYTVRDAYLEFVEPNVDGEIVELHLDFDDKYAERIDKLVEIVWKHIHRLAFPSIESYPASAKGITMFEDDLLSEKYK